MKQKAMKQKAPLFIVFSVASVLFSSICIAQAKQDFAALTRWKAAVISPKSTALMQLYSVDPSPRITVVGKTETEISPADDTEFWRAMKATQLSLKVGNSTAPRPGFQQVTFQAMVRTAPQGRTLYVMESQLWQQQAGRWKLVAVQRTDAFKLEQPMSLDAKLYPPAGGAREEIAHALTQAGKTHKRVLVIFGADWCYDCHVLDRALQRPDIAPTLKRDYEVVHVDVGEGDKNQDLMNQYQVPMKRGIPAVAVLASSGELLYSQKNGEFERARALGPEDLLEFLNKWK